MRGCPTTKMAVSAACRAGQRARVRDVNGAWVVLNAEKWATLAPPHSSTGDAESKPSGPVHPLECGEQPEAKARLWKRQK